MKDAKHKEEVTEIVEQFHIEKRAEATMKKIKVNRTNHAQQNYYQHCRVRINILVRWLIGSFVVLHAQNLKYLEVILLCKLFMQLQERKL